MGGILSYLPGGKGFYKATGAPTFGMIADKLSGQGQSNGVNGQYNLEAQFPGKRNKRVRDVLNGLLMGLGIGQQLGYAQGQQAGGCCQMQGCFQQPQVNIYNNYGGGGYHQHQSFSFASYSSSISRYLGC